MDRVDVDNFYILEKGLQEDIKRNKTIQQKIVDQEFLRRKGDLAHRNNMALQAATNSSTLLHNRRKAVRAAQEANKRKEQLLAKEIQEALDKRMEPIKTRLIELQFGGAEKREEQLKKIEQFEVQQANGVKNRKMERIEKHRQKRQDLKAKTKGNRER